MIKGLQGSQGVIVDGGNMSLPYINPNDSNSFQGLMRIRGTDIQYYDNGVWNLLPSSYATIRLDGSADNLLQWVRQKQQEEAEFKTILSNHDHPAIQIARENLNKAIAAVKQAELQLKITTKLAEDTYVGNEAEELQAP